MRAFKRPKTGLLELDEAERRLRPFARRYLGIRAIPLDHVVGTDGKVGAFTRAFDRGTLHACPGSAVGSRWSGDGEGAVSQAGCAAAAAAACDFT